MPRSEWVVGMVVDSAIDCVREKAVQSTPSLEVTRNLEQVSS